MICVWPMGLNMTHIIYMYDSYSMGLISRVNMLDLNFDRKCYIDTV